MRYTTEEQQFIRENSHSMSFTQMAKILNRSKHGISNYCKRNNLPVYIKKSKFNDEFFSKIETQEQAYILGLWYADGYILSARNRDRKESRQFGITLNLKDKELLEQINKAMSSNYPIKEYSNNHGFGKETFHSGRIIFTSDKTVSDLIALGCMENKTDILKFPNEKQVPPHLLPHFIRGYFDGDGSISYWNDNVNTGHLKFTITFTGTKEMLSGIQDFFGTQVKLSQRFPERKTNNYTLAYAGNRQIKKLLDTIYKDATIFLKRKFEKYELLK